MKKPDDPSVQIQEPSFWISFNPVQSPKFGIKSKYKYILCDINTLNTFGGSRGNPKFYPPGPQTIYALYVIVQSPFLFMWVNISNFTQNVGL